MDLITPRATQTRSPLGLLCFLVGALAAALSVVGQLLAERKHAGDWNAGHPMADQPLVHALSVTPGVILSILAVVIGCSALRAAPEHRRLALGGVALGVITLALTVMDVPGSIAFRYWYAPQWEEV